MTTARSNGKHPGGRPSKYDPAYPQRLIEFFKQRPPYTTVDGVRLANDPPVLSDFAEDLGVWPQTLYDWEHAHPEFHDALEWWRAFQKKYLLTCGLLGLTNSVITALELKNNHGYRDRNEDDGTKVITIISPPDWGSLGHALRLRTRSADRAALPAASHANGGDGVGGREVAAP